MADRTDTPEAPRWQRRPTERRREILDAAALILGERGLGDAPPGAGSCPEAGRVGSGEMSGRCPRVLRGVIEAGVEAGEFRPVDAEVLARVLGATVIGLIVGRQRFARYCDGAGAPGPSATLRELLELVERGLAKDVPREKESHRS